MVIFNNDKKIDNPERLTLTIYAGTENFSFSLYDPKETGSYFYKELTGENQTDAFAAFKDVFFDNAFFSLPFGKVWIMYRTPIFTFIPNAIYEEKSKEDFLQFQFPENQGVTLNNVISYTGISVIYKMPEDVHRFMLLSFAKPEFIHYSAPFISYFLEKVKNVNNRRMVVNLQKKGLDIFCFSGETFLLGNYFKCSNLEEAVYYILYTWKQLEFNQLDDFLHITGNSVFREELNNKLLLYIKNIYSLSIFPEIYFEGINTDHIPFELAAL